MVLYYSATGNTEYIAKRIAKRLDDECLSLLERIRNGKPLKARHIYLFEAVITVPFHPVWTRAMQPAKPFYATDKCIGCGKCEKICPLNNIYMEDRRPQWKKPCAHCMACIGNCPVEAIEFGNITQKKKKYNLKRFQKGMKKQNIDEVM